MKKLAKMLSVLLFLLLAAGMFPGTAVFAANSGSTNDYNWTFEDGVLTITPKISGITLTDPSASTATGIDKSSITSVVLGDGVSAIGDECFMNYSNLTSVSIPSSVTTIGEDAFDYCPSLSSITIPSSVTTIGTYAFATCTSLLSITIPSSVATISYGAFYYCTSLSSITIPSGVTTIDYSAFYGCTSLSSITIPSSVTTIGSYAFEGCTNLSTVTVEASSYSSNVRLHELSDVTTVRVPLGFKYAGEAITQDNKSDLIGTKASLKFYATEHAAVSADCHTAGNIKYYAGVNGVKCSEYNETTGAYTPVEDVTVPALAHKQNGESKIVKHNRVEPTYTADGAEEYWECSLCHDKFSSDSGADADKIDAPTPIPALIPTSDINLNPETLTLITGQTADLTATALPDSAHDKSLEWTSSDATVATVDTNGKVTAVKPGTATITVTSKGNAVEGGISKTCAVTVVDRVNALIENMYSVCMGREASEADVAYYKWMLGDQGMTGTQMAASLVFADEFKIKNYCDRHYVIALYNAFMGREPSEDEIANWTWRLQEGDTREQVFNFFATSGEFGDICTTAGIELGQAVDFAGSSTKAGGYCTVDGCHYNDGKIEFARRLYTVCLDREPGQNEIDAWHYNLVHGDHTALTASRFFLTSAEFVSHNYNDSAYITHVYNAMMGRDPSADDMSYWVWRLTTDNPDYAATREQVIDEFAASDEFGVLCQRYGVVRS